MIFYFTRSVPLDIQARGPLAMEVYNRELKEGHGYATRVPIMIIGQARTGKTSLKKSLKGELFDPDEGSTKGKRQILPILKSQRTSGGQAEIAKILKQSQNFC